MQKAKKRLRELFSREDYWMGMTFFVAAGSKAMRQRAALVVDHNFELVAIGCDGPVKLSQDGDHIVHAEINAVLKCKNIDGTMFLTHTPCYSCVMAVLAAGIHRIVYFPTKPLDENSIEVIRNSHSQVREFVGNLNWIRDYVKELRDAEIF